MGVMSHDSGQKQDLRQASDQTLLDLWHEGNLAARDVFLVRARDALKWLIEAKWFRWPVLRANLEPEDLLQTILKSLLRLGAAGQLQVKEGQYSIVCLLRIFANRRISNKARYLRRECRDARREVSLGEHDLPSTRDPAAEALAKDLHGFFADRLKEDQRKVALLLTAGYTVPEIAQELGLTPAKVHIRRYQIRKALGGYLGDEE